MKTNFKLSAILLCLVLAGCIETSQQSLTENKSLANSLASEDSDPNARKGGGSTGQIYLSVTVESMTESDGTGVNCKIVSDLKGAYVNGVEGVSAQFLSPNGDFSFTTNNTPRNKNLRKLKFPDGAGYDIDPNKSDNYLINVLANEDDPNPIKMQDMGIGSSQLMSMRVWGSGAIQFRLIYYLGLGLGYQTDKVLVKRTDVNIWIVESTNSKETNLNGTTNPDATAALTGGVNNDLRGYYSVPFKLTLTKIN